MGRVDERSFPAQRPRPAEARGSGLTRAVRAAERRGRARELAQRARAREDCVLAPPYADEPPEEEESATPTRVRGGAAPRSTAPPGPGGRGRFVPERNARDSLPQLLDDLRERRARGAHPRLGERREGLGADV